MKRSDQQLSSTEYLLIRMIGIAIFAFGLFFVIAVADLRVRGCSGAAGTLMCDAWAQHERLARPAE